MEWLKPFGEKILDHAKLRNGDVVLDVATGSGEPGLSAAIRVGRGRVIGTDLSEEMLKIAREKAKELGIDNYDVRLNSSARLPFDSGSFDAVISRFGVMFFPDVLRGLKEMVRVLKQGRRLCVSVWGPQDERAKSVMQTLTEELGLPRPSPEDPNPFRCSESGKITSLMREAGLHDVKEVELRTRRMHGSFGQYWEYLLDLNPLVASAFKKAKEETKAEVKLKVGERLDLTRNRNTVSFDTVAWIDYGVK